MDSISLAPPKESPVLVTTNGGNEMATEDAKREIEHRMGWSPGAVDQILADGKTYPYDEDPAKHEAILRRIEAIARASGDAVAELDARERARYFDLDHPEIQEAVSRERRRRSRRSAWRVAAVAVLFIVGVGAIATAASSLVMGVGLVGVLSGAGLFAAVLAGIGEDGYSQIRPAEFVVCLVLFIASIPTLLLMT